MTLIQDLIPIPERVNKGDYVLKLTQGVRDAERTLRDYVVTEQLVKCFGHALSFIGNAVRGGSSQACYLHGSFGSGKSHFMAVLHLILQGDSGARGIPELAEIIAKNREWIRERKFLLVPYHMIGSKNLDSAILGGYVDFIREAHPKAPLPGVFLSEKLFADAVSLRSRMGDEGFFAALGEAAGGSDEGWGDLEGGWNPARFERAVAAPPGDEDRIQLVADLVGSLFQSQRDIAKSSGEGYISLDDGLGVISRHARDLGYDAVILFLDELILWLASHSADLGFIQREGQKLGKLVESHSADRPAPIVSFVARQRDLRDLVGKEVSGAIAHNFSDILGHMEGRFDTITLEDRNLPKIAQKRVLRPKDEAARKEIDAAFERTAKVREEVLNTLLTREGDRAMFRQVYPFSPALVQTLIAVSSLLQRERTALKVMLQLLVNHRETLRLGDVVPVGDLFDVIAHGEEAFSEEMRSQFENARRLYHEKLLPLLEAQHQLRREKLPELPPDDPARKGFVNDDRLLKTLLLGALAPGVESLRGLTAGRLAALNHGTIASPIPGREGQLVAQRVKKWAAAVGEIKVGEEANPSISVQLTGVDTDGIINQVRREDNEGNRLRLIREILFARMGIENKDQFFLEHAIRWRGTVRTVEILFGNTRALPESSFMPTGEQWKLILDYPFDSPNHGPRDDISRLQEIREKYPDGLRTVAWLPSFFSRRAIRDMGMLVLLEYLLTGERYGQYAAHLSPREQASARALLENRRSMLRRRVENDLCAAYGLDFASEDGIDSSHELSDHFQSLWPGFAPRPPAAPNLQAALEDLLGQALEHQFPAHPRFETEVRISALKKALDVAIQAARTPDGRVPVDPKLRPAVRQIVDPLRLGEMAETHFVLGQHWKTHFNRRAAESGGTVSVRELRSWMDAPNAMGLPEPVGNLVILVYAEQTNRSFFHHGLAATPTLEKLPADMELRERTLPAEEAWGAARNRAGLIFGLEVSPLLNAANLTALVKGVEEELPKWRKSSGEWVKRLESILRQFVSEPESAPRLKTARAVHRLLAELGDAEGTEETVVAALAEAAIETSETAMARSMKSAPELVRFLSEDVQWKLFEVSGRGEDDERRAIRAEVANALARDEYAEPLADFLKMAQNRAITALSEESLRTGTATGREGRSDSDPETPPKPAGIEIPGAEKGKSGRGVVARDQRLNLDLAAARTLLAELEAQLTRGRTLTLNLSWVIHEEPDS
ncbi:MAG: hypothetical protein ACLFN9_18150 [Desulfococcaceae bacterium]